MLVHLTGSARNLDKDLLHFRKIIEVLHKNNCVLARDWVEPTYNHMQQLSDKDKSEGLDWDAIYQDNMESIARADVIIIEATNMRFAQGYQTALALQQKKPTLVISREPFEGKMISGADNTLLQASVYKSEEDLEKIVDKFVQENRVDTKDMRFNFFIDRPIYNYLRWAALKTGKTKAEVLRELVKNEIDKKTK